MLLHGFLGAAKIWHHLIENLQKTYRVIAIDLPGHGQSPVIGYAHTMERLAGAVKAVMDTLKLKKYVIIGHSMGGYAALAFADLYPDHVKGLCLFHSSSYADTEQKKTDRTRAIGLVKANKTIYTKTTIANLFAKKNHKYLKEEMAFAHGIAKETSKEGIIAALLGMRDRPSRELVLSLVHYPVLMVIGEHDNVLPPDQLLEQAQSIKNATVLYLEHDGHFGFLESPRLCQKEIRKWLRKCFR